MNYQQRRDEFVRVLAFAPVSRARRGFKFQLREKLLDARQERRRIQRTVVGVKRGTGQHQPLSCAGAGNVAEVALAADVQPGVRAERETATFERVAIRVREQRGGRRWRGEHALVEAEDKRKLDVGIARAVNRADQDLIQRGRNHADGQVAQARFQNRQPLAQRQRFGGKGAGHVVQPGVHLLPDGGVDGAGDLKFEI